MNTYKGKNGYEDFLNPKNHITPLVELPRSLNPYADHDIHLYVKLLTFLPAHNVKSIPAYNMLQTHDEIAGKDVVESSSGNTAFSISTLKHVFGFNSFTALASTDVTPGKKSMLDLVDANIEVYDQELCPDPENPNSTINIARRRGNNEGVVCLDQYQNDANPQAHKELTAPQIEAQLPEITDFVASLGTAGTLSGCKQYFKDDVVTVGAVRAPNNPVPGPRTKGLLRETQFDVNQAADYILESTTKQAYTQSKKLCEHGLLVGPSTGLIYDVTLQYLEKTDFSEPRHIVFIACDLPFPYLEQYKKRQYKAYTDTKISAENLWKLHPANPEVNTENITILDIRPRKQYDHVHIPRSKHTTENTVIQAALNADLETPVVLLCEHDGVSASVAHELRQLGTTAYHLEDGIASWSTKPYPRVVEGTCIKEH